MAGELQNYLRGLAGRLSADIAAEWAAAVEAELVGPIRAAAPEGKTDHLKQSVRKVQGTLTSEGGAVLLANGTGEYAGITQWVVMAGGPLTTKEIAHPHGAQHSYDYAIATEFGTSKEPAEPFFWPTVRARWPRLMARAEQLVSSRVAKE